MQIHKHGEWIDVVNVARNTANKPELGKEPSNDFKRRILLAEHSPIRVMFYSWKWEGIKTWVSQHFARHNKYAEHFVQTQREDRTGADRDSKRQDALVDHIMHTNAQELISISRKRLCSNAHKETRDEWKKVLECLREVDPILADQCVVDCVYRGHCYEVVCCGFHRTVQFEKQLQKYREGIN